MYSQEETPVDSAGKEDIMEGQLVQQFLVIMQDLGQSRDKPDSKPKYSYEAHNLEKSYRAKKQNYCASCSSWEQKTQDLIWGYQELLSVKEKQLETISKMVNKLDEDNNKLQSKVQSLTKKLKASQVQLDKSKSSNSELQSIINYYKEREVDLLSQLKNTENELFTKTVQVKDDAEAKEQMAIEELVSDSAKQKKVAQVIKKSETLNMGLIPVLANSESFGRIIQKNLCDLQKMSQEKMMLQLKHRMAVLRAIELSVLK